jgi:hypothetical protein
MTRCGFFGTCVVLLAVGGVALASGNPAVDALRQQVKTLRAEEKAVVKAIEGLYDPLIRNDRLSEKQLIVLKETLRQQEKQQLALATTAADRDRIRAEFDALRKQISGQFHADATQIAQLRTQRSAHITQVHNQYRAAIAAIEAQIKAISKMPRSKR